MPDENRVVGGVDTHRDRHTAAALDAAGGVLGTASFPATGARCGQLWRWLRGLGDVECVGVEGISSYGAGLSRFVAGEGSAGLGHQQLSPLGRRRLPDGVARRHPRPVMISHRHDPPRPKAPGWGGSDHAAYTNFRVSLLGVAGLSARGLRSGLVLGADSTKFWLCACCKTCRVECGAPRSASVSVGA